MLLVLCGDGRVVSNRLHTVLLVFYGGDGSGGKQRCDDGLRWVILLVFYGDGGIFQNLMSYSSFYDVGISDK